MKVLYIAGATRSGSTLFHDIMSQIDGFEGVGELRDIWRYGIIQNRLCGCGERLRSCDYWTSALAAAFGDAPVDAERLSALTERFRTRDLLLATRRRRSRVISDLHAVIDAVAALYVEIGRTRGARVIVDSSKNPAFGYLIASRPDLDVRYVHLVRDAPAVAYSLGKRKESEPGRRLPQKTPWQSSADWILRNVAVDHRLSRHRDSIRLRYEDLVDEPTAAVEAVCALMDEPPGALGFISGTGVDMTVRPHSVFGNPGRFRTGVTVLRPDQEWRSQMDQRSSVIVKALTLPLRRRYGYVATR